MAGGGATVFDEATPGRLSMCPPEEDPTQITGLGGSKLGDVEVSWRRLKRGCGLVCIVYMCKNVKE